MKVILMPKKKDGKLDVGTEFKDLFNIIAEPMTQNLQCNLGRIQPKNKKKCKCKR